MAEKLLTETEMLELRDMEIVFVNATHSFISKKMTHIIEKYPKAKILTFYSTNTRAANVNIFASGSEFDVIHVRDLQNVTEYEWITLLSRVGRGTGTVNEDSKWIPNMPYTQVFAGCALESLPDWIKKRETTVFYECIVSGRHDPLRKSEIPD